ncbi:hypothetical protein G3M58_15480, partial [Streptomyces sp. SID7499]|nr:hypothetical protein [Streptomyces sp. SID7499]
PGDHDADEVLAGYWTAYASDEVAPEDAGSDTDGTGTDADAEGTGPDADGSADAGSWPGLAPVPAREPAEDADTAAAGLAG